ncbi:MAG: hypothetical protein RRB22_07765 [Gammaproteobacteria bacterium]|nr:hypothetical protein [Gammaproteobacteria bacterium]
MTQANNAKIASLYRWDTQWKYRMKYRVNGLHGGKQCVAGITAWPVSLYFAKG